MKVQAYRLLPIQAFTPVHYMLVTVIIYNNILFVDTISKILMVVLLFLRIVPAARKILRIRRTNMKELAAKIFTMSQLILLYTIKGKMITCVFEG